MGADDSTTGTITSLLEPVCADPDVVFAVAFGSRTTGTARQSSDLDVALKFSEDLSARDRFRKRCFLSADLQRPDSPPVDVADLESLPIEVAHDAVSGAFVCGDERAFERYKADLEAAYTAGRNDRRRRRAELIDRIAEEGLRG